MVRVMIRVSPSVARMASTRARVTPVRAMTQGTHKDWSVITAETNCASSESHRVMGFVSEWSTVDGSGATRYGSDKAKDSPESTRTVGEAALLNPLSEASRCLEYTGSLGGPSASPLPLVRVEFQMPVCDGFTVTLRIRETFAEDRQRSPSSL
jgi:hypothetical protein